MKYYLHFLIWLILEARAVFKKQLCAFFGSNENKKICFWNLLTFRKARYLFSLHVDSFWGLKGFSNYQQNKIMVKSNFQDNITCTLKQGIEVLQLGKSLLEVTFFVFYYLVVRYGSKIQIPNSWVMSISKLETPQSWLISWKKNKVKK